MPSGIERMTQKHVCDIRLAQRDHCSQNAVVGHLWRCPYINIALTLSVLTRRVYCTSVLTLALPVRYHRGAITVVLLLLVTDSVMHAIASALTPNLPARHHTGVMTSTCLHVDVDKVV